MLQIGLVYIVNECVMNEKKQVILVTGCSSGFGYLTALKFARKGWLTFASLRDVECVGAKELWEIRNRENLSLELVKIDVTEENSVKEGVAAVVKKVGKIDVLINNAGFGYLGPVEEFSIDEVKSQFETNVFGVLRMIKEVVPLMRLQNSGVVINLSSINGLVPFPLFSIYSSSKFAVETLSEGLRFELSHFGIKVALVEPGSFLTNFTANRKHPIIFGREDSSYKELVDNFFRRYQKTHDQARKSFVSRIADPQKVADLIYKIANEKNPKPRYLVGGDAHLFYWLRKILPVAVWEWFLHKVYNW